MLFGKTGNNPFCHHRALELLRRGKRERLERTRAADGVPFDFGRFEIIEEDWPADELEIARAISAGANGWLSPPEHEGNRT